MWRPLDGVGTIKLKLGLAIVVAVAAGSTISAAGVVVLDAPAWLGPPIAVVIALGLVQLLGRGMTSPLREMARAARAMADGEWDQRVTATSADEVGQLGRAFNEMAAEMAAVDRMRRDLVANVSHELRTPLSALQARLENLADGVDQLTPGLIEAMLSQTARLNRLVDQLLDLSRLESGAVPLRLEAVEGEGLLNAVASEARLQAPDRRIEVVPSPGVSLLADPDRIHQVFANLVDNAVRHAPGAPIRLSGFQSDGHAVLTVADEGPGVAEPDRVFERFYRSDPSRTGGATAAGAGLGLSIVRWIVDLHGGDIEVTANEPRGCRVTVTLPTAGGAPS